MADFNALDTFKIKTISLYRKDWPKDEKLDIALYLHELAYFEDMFSGTTFATLTLLDPINLPEHFPLVGGELVDISYMSPAYPDARTITFVVAKVSDRLNNDLSKNQIYSLSLVTQDYWENSRQDLSKSFKGTYDNIVTQLITALKTDRNIITDPAIYNQTFVSPYWNILQSCEWIASRAYDQQLLPFFFWETLDGYNFKSVGSIYAQEPYTKIVIEPSQIGLLTDNVWRRAMHFEHKEHSDRLRQLQDKGFGVHLTMLDRVSRRVSQTDYSYKTLSGSDKFAKIDKFPLYPESEDLYKNSFIMTKADRSHEGQVVRNMIMAMLDTYRFKLTVPGDSGYRAGQIVELDIPDLSAAQQQNEAISSGRWLVVSLRHLVTRTTFSTNLELCKDSHAVDIASLIQGIKNDSTNARSNAAPTVKPTNDVAIKPILPPTTSG